MTEKGWRVWFADFTTMQSTSHTFADVEAYAAQSPCVYAMIYFDEDYAPGKPYREDRSGGDFIEVGPLRLPGFYLHDHEFEEIKRQAYAAEAL